MAGVLRNPDPMSARDYSIREMDVPTFSVQRAQIIGLMQICSCSSMCINALPAFPSGCSPARPARPHLWIDNQQVSARGNRR